MTESSPRITFQGAHIAESPISIHAQKPRTLEEAVDKLVALQLEDARVALTAEYTAKEAALLARLAGLEAASSGPPVAAAAAHKPASAGGKK